MNEKATILAVDDMSESLALLAKILTQEGYDVGPADSGELALAAVAASPPDLILLDVRMKGMNGLEVCRRLKAREETRHIPIILISAFADVKEWVEGLQLGAADYVTKPFQTEELLTRVKTHLSLSRANVSIERQATTLRLTNEQLHSEIVERQRAEAELCQSLDRTERSRRALLGTLEDQKRTQEELALKLETETAMNRLQGLCLESRPVEEIAARALALILSLKWLAVESKGAIFLADKAAEWLHLRVHQGLSNDLCTTCSTVPFGRCICGRAAAARAVQFADRVDEHHDIRSEGMQPHGHYCVPMLFGDRILGVINLYVKEGHIRHSSEEDFLNAVANTVAGAIERKRGEATFVEQLDELRRWHDALVGREGRVLEVKKEVNDLLTQLGQPPRYLSVTEGQNEEALD